MHVMKGISPNSAGPESGHQAAVTDQGAGSQEWTCNPSTKILDAKYNVFVA